VHVFGEPDDKIFPLAAFMPTKAHAEAIVILNQQGIVPDAFTWAYAEYWDTGVRKWVIRDVIKTLEVNHGA
jgi:hypothetical protein